MRLKYQLLLMLLAVSATLIVILYVLSNWSLNHGFIDYINRNAMERLAMHSADLADEYQQQGNSWDKLRNNPRALGKIVRPDRRNEPLVADLGDDPGKGKRRRPSRRDSPNFVLVDENFELIVGRWSDRREMLWQEVTIEDKTVGSIGVPRETKIAKKLDLVYAKQQKRNFGYAAIAMALLSFLLAVPLASFFVRPILTLNKAVSQISGGDYSHRVKAARKDELGELTTRINHLASTLESNQQARQQWMAEISHELRTPVAILQGEIEAMQDGVSVLDDKSMASLHAETSRLSRLIDDLHELSMSDLGALNYSFTPVALSSVINDRIQATSSVLSTVPLTVERDYPKERVWVEGDAQRLEQLVDNLMQNSARYTDPGGSIKVTITLERGYAILEWADTGPGVSDEQLPKLFDPLFRVEASRNRSSGGTGLGLSIVRKIVESHQGQISASHSELGGLLLRISLPVSDRDPP